MPMVGSRLRGLLAVEKVMVAYLIEVLAQFVQPVILKTN
jgi:hypothetical protein